jgi:hypothetical protein
METEWTLVPCFPTEPRQITTKPINIDDMNIMNLGLGKIIYSPEQLKEFMRFQESRGCDSPLLQTDAGQGRQLLGLRFT